MTEPQSPATEVRIPTKLRDLTVKEFSDEHFVVGSGLMSANSMLYIAGPPKSFKSWILKTVLLEIAGGIPLFGANRAGKHGEKLWTFPVDKPRRVLYLEQEIGEVDLQTRFNMMLEGFPKAEKEVILDNLYSYSTDHSLQLDKPEGVAAIAGVIEQCQPEIVAFDPLIEFHTLDENKAQEMSLVMHSLDSLREKYNFATVICHHQGKSGQFDGRTGPDLMRGSSVMYGKGDSFIMVKYDKTEELLKVDFTIRRGKGIPPMRLSLDPETMLVRFYGWGGAGRPRDNSKQDVE